MTENGNVLDLILVEVGEFGKYQRRVIFFIVIASAIIFFSSMIFVFETKPVNYRCKIDNCEVEPAEFKPTWWKNVAPSDDDGTFKCLVYQRINNNDTKSCNSEDFNKSVEEECEAFVYESSEVSIMHDYNLHCEENLWKLTLVGTIHNVGILVGLPIFGILSDKFGRKNALIYGMVLSAIMGLLRSFANTYSMFLVLEFLDASFISGAYATVWILGVEYVGPKQRIIVTVLISSFIAIGGVIQTLIAWKVQSWRILLQIVYSAQLILVFYHWLIPESTRWLLSKQRFAEAKHTLENIAKTNGKPISQINLKKLENVEATGENANRSELIQFLYSKLLLLRLCICATCWVGCLFLYYGLTIYSVQLSSESYLDLMLTIMVEIPGSMAYIVTDRIGRRLSLSGGFFIIGLASFASIFTYTEQNYLQLTFYLIGKFGATITFSVLSTITTEMFPTSIRNTLLSTCLMLGGVGAIAAPQLPLLRTIWSHLPMVLFGTVGIFGSFLSLLLPETMNTELPNTIKEAEDIGKNTKVFCYSCL